jgi:glycosyltransferase involved in cell wall biosynthesis
VNVLFVTAAYPTPDEHAVGVFVKEHARAVAPFCDVAVIHLDRTDTRRIQVDEVKSEEFPTWRVRYPRSPSIISYAANVLGAMAAYRALRRRGFEPDVIHAHFFLAGAPAVLIGRAARKPVVVTEQWSVFLPGDPAGLSPLVRGAAKFAFEHADCVMPVSKALRDGILSQGIRGRFHVVPNVVDVKRFHPPPVATNNVAGRARILSVGALYEAKGWEYLLEAAGLLAAERDDFHLDIVGDGPLRAEYEAAGRARGLTERVTFTGWRTKDEVASLMRDADVFVLASRYDSNPCALIEALATGLPVVATAVGGIPEMVSADSGVLVPPHDPAELARGLAAVLDERHRFDRAAIAAAAGSRYGSDHVGREFVAIYEDALRRRR